MSSIALKTFYHYVQGALILQAFLFLCIFLLYKRKEFLLYMLYLTLLAAYYAINSSEILLGIPQEHPAIYFLLRYMNMPLVMLFNVVYLFFISALLGLRHYKHIFVLIKILLGVILISLFVYSIFRFLHLRVNIIFNIINILGLVGGLLLAFMIVKQKIAFGNFISLGILLYSMASIASAATVLISKSNAETFLAKSPLVYVKTGVLADMVLYFIALIGRWVKTEKRLELASLEAELKVEKERNRIRRDFHDEIGGTLSGISMYSHLGKEQIKLHNLAAAERSLIIVQQSSADIVDKLNDIVWLINPGQDTLRKLVQRLEEYAGDMAAIKSMQVKIIVPEIFSEQSLPVESRRNIYLFCKEAINNAVKYSKANLLELTVKENKQFLEISITDNGQGFDVEDVKRGNGLDNMQKRATELGAEFNLQSKPGEGCYITLKVKITQ